MEPQQQHQVNAKKLMIASPRAVAANLNNTTSDNQSINDALVKNVQLNSAYSGNKYAAQLTQRKSRGKPQGQSVEPPNIH